LKIRLMVLLEKREIDVIQNVDVQSCRYEINTVLRYFIGQRGRPLEREPEPWATRRATLAPRCFASCRKRCAKRMVLVRLSDARSER
jgi:hypothetical protein